MCSCVTCWIRSYNLVHCRHFPILSYPAFPILSYPFPIVDVGSKCSKSDWLGWRGNNRKSDPSKTKRTSLSTGTAGEDRRPLAALLLSTIRLGCWGLKSQRFKVYKLPFLYSFLKYCLHSMGMRRILTIWCSVFQRSLKITKWTNIHFIRVTIYLNRQQRHAEVDSQQGVWGHLREHGLNFTASTETVVCQDSLVLFLIFKHQKAKLQEYERSNRLILIRE